MLEPEIAAFVDRSKALYDVASPNAPIGEQRASYDRYAAAFDPGLPEGVQVDDAALRSRAGHAIPMRLYRKAEADADRVGLLFFHGGGFVLGSLDSHRFAAARLAADTGLPVMAVDYRLAPEHPAWAAHEDCLAVTLAARSGGLPFAMRLPRRWQLVGDSAGGHIAACVALRLRDEAPHEPPGLPALAGLALVYPMLGLVPQPPSRDTEAQAPMLTVDDVLDYGRLYWGASDADARWHQPLQAVHLERLPPMFIAAAEHDPLRDDARVFAGRVEQAGGEARLWDGAGLVHGCWRALQTSPAVRRMHLALCRFLVDQADRTTSA